MGEWKVTIVVYGFLFVGIKQIMMMVVQLKTKQLYTMKGNLMACEKLLL